MIFQLRVPTIPPPAPGETDSSSSVEDLVELALSTTLFTSLILLRNGVCVCVCVCVCVRVREV